MKCGYTVIKPIEDKDHDNIFEVLDGKEKRILKTFDKPVMSEIDISARLHHTNLIQERKIITPDAKTSNDVYGILMDQGTTTLYKSTEFTVVQRIKYLADIANGLHFLHTRGILHQDIKPSNCVVIATTQIDDLKTVTPGTKAVLIDYGSSSYYDVHNPFIVEKRITNITYTQSYEPPELTITSSEYTIEKSRYKLGCFHGVKSEVWAFGMTCLNTLLARPFLMSIYLTDARCGSWDKFLERYINEHLGTPEKTRKTLGALLVDLGEYKNSMVDLLSGMLCVDPTKRSSMSQVVTHPMFQKFHNESHHSVVPWSLGSKKPVFGFSFDISEWIKRLAEIVPDLRCETIFLAVDLYYRAFAVTSQKNCGFFACLNLAYETIHTTRCQHRVDTNESYGTYFRRLLEKNHIVLEDAHREIIAEVKGIIYPDSVYHACKNVYQLKWVFDRWLFKPEYLSIDRSSLGILDIPLSPSEQALYDIGTYDKNLGLKHFLALTIPS
jgi:serine/threonine protein kinase